MIPGWKTDIHQAYLDVLRMRRRISPAEPAAQLQASERHAVYWLTDLVRDGKVRILTVEIVEEESAATGPRIIGSPASEMAELSAA